MDAPVPPINPVPNTSNLPDDNTFPKSFHEDGGGSADFVQPYKIASGTTRGVQQLGGPNIYTDAGNKQIIVKDDLPRVLMGNQPNFGEGLYVSKPDVDVTDITDPSQFIFNSSQNIFKIVQEGTTLLGTFTGPNTGVYTIPHNLGFSPIPLAFLNNFAIDGVSSNLTQQLPVYLTADFIEFGGISFLDYIYCLCDDVNFYIIYLNSTSDPTLEWTVTYYLLQETAKLPRP